LRARADSGSVTVMSTNRRFQRVPMLAIVLAAWTLDIALPSLACAELPAIAQRQRTEKKVLPTTRSSKVL